MGSNPITLSERKKYSFSDRFDARPKRGGAEVVRRHVGHHLLARRLLAGPGEEGEVQVPQRAVARDRRGTASGTGK
jgi:hypothetical protein